MRSGASLHGSIRQSRATVLAHTDDTSILAYLHTRARTDVGCAVERAERQVKRAAREQHDQLVAPDQPVQRAHLQATASEIRSFEREFGFAPTTARRTVPVGRSVNSH